MDESRVVGSLSDRLTSARNQRMQMEVMMDSLEEYEAIYKASKKKLKHASVAGGEENSGMISRNRHTEYKLLSKQLSVSGSTTDDRRGETCALAEVLEV